VTEKPEEQQRAIPLDPEEAIAPIRRDATSTLAASAGPAQGAVAGRRLPVTLIVGITLVVLLALVFFALPRWVGSDPGAGAAAVPTPAEAAPANATAALSPAERAAVKAEAEAALAEVLQLDEQLRNRSANVWGAEEYAAFDAVAREGDDAFLADDFIVANDRYATALGLGRELTDRSNEIMSAALNAGDAAVAAGNARLAVEQYQIVLSVDPDNERAVAGTARAEKLPEVLALAREADELRQAGELAAARDKYAAVLAIDADWEPAQRALSDVTTAIANAHFDRQLSAGYAALAEENYDTAIEAFKAALAVRRGSDAAREGLAQAEQGQKLDAIALAEIRALAFERRELWDQAIERYEVALDTDATLAFAVDGLARSRARADLDRKLVNLIENPRLLLDDEILQDARDILGEALEIAESGERIAAQTVRLSALIEAAASPMTVRLQSDQKTEVTVYRVGALGAFAETEIEVRPGTYTVIGSRSGYRDVRQTFTVLPGRPIDPVRVVCVEPI